MQNFDIKKQREEWKKQDRVDYMLLFFAGLCLVAMLLVIAMNCGI